jgi:serine/threonine protein kinase
MPLVTGRSAQELLDAGGAMTPGDASRIAAAVARGLAAAHELGIIHRDVKPGNILVGANGEIRLADFGMAKFTDPELANLSDHGRWMGTPHYMSPEQFRGEGIDHRADIYSLGATYFTLLAGRPPFAGAKALELVTKHFDEAPPDLRTLVPSMPPACAAIAEKALHKHPADRFSSAAEMADALERAASAFRL